MGEANPLNPPPAIGKARMAEKNGAPIKIDQRKVADLVPFARNSRTHSDAQVAQIAASIREFGFTLEMLPSPDSAPLRYAVATSRCQAEALRARA